MAKGGTRSRAGRPGNRLVAESAMRIDIRRWHKPGYLVNARSFTWKWTCEGDVTGTIGVTAFSDSLRLNYSIGGHDASQTIWTRSTPCHYGGSRLWFACPACHDRAAVLYLRSGRFACRQCQRVSYRSQSGSAIDRVCARFHRLDALAMAPKPKWQRKATRQRLWDRYEVASEQFERVLAMGLRAIGLADWAAVTAPNGST